MCRTAGDRGTNASKSAAIAGFCYIGIRLLRRFFSFARLVELFEDGGVNKVADGQNYPEVSTGDNRWDEKAGLRRDALSSQVIDALAAQEIRRPVMKKPSTMTRCWHGNVRNGQLAIGLDVGDRSSFYCVLNETGEVILEARVATSPEVMKKTFGKMPRSRIALETGTHSPWISRVLSDLGHEVIVAHARNVRLIGESRQKDDRLDAQALARLARIDPQLLSPIQHRSA
jgi:Transposase